MYDFFYVDESCAVAFLKLWLTLVGLLQQLLGCWGACFFSDVIDFRLVSVTIPRWLCFRSSSLLRVYDDYYFYGWGRGLPEG